MELWIICKLYGKEELSSKTIQFLEENIPDIDYSCICDTDGYYVSGTENFIFESGNVYYGYEEFFDESGSETLEEGTQEYEIAWIDNCISCFEYYILLIELENDNKLEELDIIDFLINDGSQFGYQKDVECAKRDLEEYKDSLKELLKTSPPAPSQLESGI